MRHSCLCHRSFPLISVGLLFLGQGCALTLLLLFIPDEKQPSQPPASPLPLLGLPGVVVRPGRPTGLFWEVLPWLLRAGGSVICSCRESPSVGAHDGQQLNLGRGGAEPMLGLGAPGAQPTAVAPTVTFHFSVSRCSSVKVGAGESSALCRLWGQPVMSKHAERASRGVLLPTAILCLRPESQS